MPAFEPSDEQRRLVWAFSGFGIPQEEIARHLEIDAKTLRKHFRHELDHGATEATAKVAQSLFQMATVGKNVAAAIFWMKARAGWSEKQRIHVTADDELNQLSDEQLMRMIFEIQEKTAESSERWRQRFAEEDAAKARALPGPEPQG
jgi:hypothetical protein